MLCPRLCGAGLCWERVMVVDRAFPANPAPSLPCGMDRQNPGGTWDPREQLRIHPRDAGRLVFPQNMLYLQNRTPKIKLFRI